MRIYPLSPDFYSGNRTKIEQNLPNGAIAIIHSNDEMPRNGDQYFPYRQSSDMLYLTGIEQEQSVLVISKIEGWPTTLFIRRPNLMLETWEGKKLEIEEARKICGIEKIQFLESYEGWLKEVMTLTKMVYLNSNEYPKFFPSISSRDERLGLDLRNRFPLHDYKRLAPLLWESRAIKEVEEINRLHDAISVTGEAFGAILHDSHSGMKEFEIEAIMNYHFTRHGAAHAYQPIVAAAERACTLHYTTNHQVIEDNSLVLLDFGAEYGGYAADCSRTFPIMGHFTPRQRQCYEAVLRVMEKTIPLYTPGNTINSINKQVYIWMEEEAIGLGLLKADEVKAAGEGVLIQKYFMHGTAHFLGLDVHDVGRKDMPFQKGMVLTCEPGIYIKKEGIGIRIEDNIMVADEPVNLMQFIPKEVEAIERLSKK